MANRLHSFEMFQLARPHHVIVHVLGSETLSASGIVCHPYHIACGTARGYFLEEPNLFQEESRFASPEAAPAAAVKKNGVDESIDALKQLVNHSRATRMSITADDRMSCTSSMNSENHWC
jgi:hypothetical protein